MDRPTIIDLFYKPQHPAQVTPLPDGSVELAWEREGEGGKSAFTVILRPDHFDRLIETGREIMLLNASRVRVPVQGNEE